MGTNTPLFFVSALVVLINGVLAVDVDWAPTQCGKANLITQWGKQVNPSSVLPAYPRPQMARGDNTWQNLNGIWEFQPANPTDAPPFGRTLSGNILVPFPVESCLSGVGQNYKFLWYRLVFNSRFTSGTTLLHFGSVDWKTAVWVNKNFVGNHTGGYDRFHFDITSYLTANNNELIVYVYDPSDQGFQPNGKQRISAINSPGGDTYTPASGIWQTVWLENVPANNYISNLRILADTQTLTVTAFTTPDNTGPLHGVDRPGGDMAGSPITMNTHNHWECQKLCLNTTGCVGWSFDVPMCDSTTQGPLCWLKSTNTAPIHNDCRISGIHQGTGVTVKFVVTDTSGNTVASGAGVSGVPTTINIPNPKLWSPDSPYLYTLTVSTSNDQVKSYFGMRSVSLGHYTHPAVPDTGPQNGVDRGGADMPGSPFTLPSADPNLCWNRCKSTSGCVNWAYAIPNCNGGGYTQPTCWLKSSFQSPSPDGCRVSGALAQPSYPARRPNLNGQYTFLAGWLDQSFWPDGIYTAPTDEGLAFDVQAVKTFGLNTVRLHQKVNPERWYWYSDSTGVIILQDMFQKYGGASSATIAPFIVDLYRMIDNEYNHPSIIQWEVFNEFDCVGVFDAALVTQIVQELDPSRLVDTNSGGPANNLYIANVNDVHTYPYPGDPKPSATQYAMIGEFGGVGAFVQGKEWVPNACGTYLKVNTPADEASTYVNMTKLINTQDVSVSIYTQITDVELECDGFLNYDRTNKFNQAETQSIYTANQNLIKSSNN